MRIIAALMLLVASVLHGLAAFSMIQFAGDTPAVTCNFRTGVATGTGAGTCVSSLPTCDGVTDDTSAFDAFATWATGTWQVGNTGLIALYIAPGSNCQLTTTASTFAGILKLRVIGYGTSLGGSYFHLAGLGQLQNNTSQALTQTVSAGATSVILVTAGQTSRFTVGQYALMTGIDLQGNGFPTNQFYFEYVKVTALDGGCTGSGTVCFDRALALTYKSTWPIYNTGGAFDVNHGGPAMLYALNSAFDTEVEWRGVTFTQGGCGDNSCQFDANGRQVVFRDVTFTQARCIFPSVNYSFSLINVTANTCVMEFDKLVQNATFTNVTWHDINMQSTGANLFTITNSTVNSMVGSAKRNVFTDSSFATLLFGPNQGYGRTDEVVCTRCAITTFTDGSAQPNLLNQATCGSMAAGVITCTDAGGPYRWAVPGNNIGWTDNSTGRAWSQFWQITDVTQSGGNTIITTTNAGGYPILPTGAGMTLQLFVHPAPKFTCVSCTGNAQMVSMSLAPAAQPLWSYQQYTYTGSIGTNVQSGYGMWGKASSITVNVTNAYTGGGALTYDIGKNYTMWIATNAFANWDAVVNAKTAGTRTITLSGVTGNQTGDTGLALPNSTSSIFGAQAGTSGPFYSADVSGSCPGAGCPSVTVIIQADQGVVNP